MTKSLRLLSLTAAVATVVLGAGAARALACGNSNGYSYARVGASSSAFGISAQIAPASVFDVLDGHVAGWVGVSGRDKGPHGASKSLRVGSVGFPGTTGSGVYFEVTRPGAYPTYHEVSTGVALGTYTRVTVLEMHNRPNRWRVWVNHEPVSPPILLPNSHNGLKATVTTESWDGGTGGPCNDFSYTFRHVLIAHAPGGDWQQLTGDPIPST